MHRLYTETLEYGLERQQQLLGERGRERLLLSNGQRFDLSHWVLKAAEWAVDRLAELGQNQPCVDNDLACELSSGA